MQRILPLRAVVLAVFVLVSCSESGTRGPTAPTPPPTPLLPLAASIAPAADTVQTGQTAQFTLEITGGDPNTEPAWTCAAADTLVASATATAAGCSATGTGTGTTTIAATVTRGTATATASASLRVTPPPLAASIAPAADTVQTGQTAQFTLEITGGDPNAEPAWTCAAADTLVASATATAAGCSATGTGTGTTTIAATVTRGTATATASASLRVTPPPLAASIAPAADTVQTGQTAQFTLEITGGDPNAEPAWTCAAADTLVASATATAAGCSATGTGTGTTTIAATVTRGTATATASASLRVEAPTRGERDAFAYWDANGNGDLTCPEARSKDEGLRLPAYKDNRDGTGLIYAWLQRGRSSDSDQDGVTCETTHNPGGYVPVPPPLAASIAPAADTIETGQTAQFTLEITGGDPNAEPAWTCAAADTLVASATATAAGCSATGTGTGTTTIAATVTRGTATATASASLRVTPPRTGDRMCPADSPTWMGLPVCEEVERTGYDRDAFGSAYSSLEDDIIRGLPKSGGQVYTPYSCKLFDIRPDGTAATDIEHIVALAEAYDSGLPELQFRTFAGDLANLTIADPTVNRIQKSDRDAADWRPSRNTGWFAARVVAVKQKYGLSVNPAERDALASMLASDLSRTVTCN